MFPVSYHPFHHIPAEDIEDHVKIKIRPLYRSFQFGNVPRPELIRNTGKQFGLLVMRMRKGTLTNSIVTTMPAKESRNRIPTESKA